MWIFLSLIAGLADALRDAQTKRSVSTIPRPLITWSYSVCALPFFIPVLLLNLPHEIPPVFWAFLATTSTAHVAGGLLLVRALQLSDLSLCAPMVAFTPVFLLVVGPVVTGDVPSLAGVAGAALVTFGSYVLYLRSSSQGVLGPFRALSKEKGARIMLGLAFLWSVTGSLDRMAVRMFSLSFWGSAQLCAIAILLIPILIRQKAFSQPISRQSAKALLMLGGANALSLGAYLLALQLVPVHFVICLKRSSIFFSVLLGRILFNEKFVEDRLPGALIMLAGVVVMCLYG